MYMRECVQTEVSSYVIVYIIWLMCTVTCYSIEHLISMQKHCLTGDGWHFGLRLRTAFLFFQLIASGAKVFSCQAGYSLCGFLLASACCVAVRTRTSAKHFANTYILSLKTPSKLFLCFLDNMESFAIVDAATERLSVHDWSQSQTETAPKCLSIAVTPTTQSFTTPEAAASDGF